MRLLFRRPKIFCVICNTRIIDAYTRIRLIFTHFPWRYWNRFPTFVRTWYKWFLEAFIRSFDSISLIKIKLDKSLYLILASLQIPKIKIKTNWDNAKNILRIFVTVIFKAVYKPNFVAYSLMIGKVIQQLFIDSVVVIFLPCLFPSKMIKRAC